MCGGNKVHREPKLRGFRPPNCHPFGPPPCYLLRAAPACSSDADATASSSSSCAEPAHAPAVYRPDDIKEDAPGQDFSPPPAKLCAVCRVTTETYHLNYGANTCFSCRAFFRRAIQKTRNPLFQCKKAGRCDVTEKTRRQCQRCRYDLCLRAGMRADSVLDDGQKQVRFRRMLKKKKRLEKKLSAEMRRAAKQEKREQKEREKEEKRRRRMELKEIKGKTARHFRKNTSKAEKDNLVRASRPQQQQRQQRQQQQQQQNLQLSGDPMEVPDWSYIPPRPQDGKETLLYSLLQEDADEQRGSLSPASSTMATLSSSSTSVSPVASVDLGSPLGWAMDAPLSNVPLPALAASPGLLQSLSGDCTSSLHADALDLPEPIEPVKEEAAADVLYPGRSDDKDLLEMLGWNDHDLIDNMLQTINSPSDRSHASSDSFSNSFLQLSPTSNAANYDFDMEFNDDEDKSGGAANPLGTPLFTPPVAEATKPGPVYMHSGVQRHEMNMLRYIDLVKNSWATVVERVRFDEDVMGNLVDFHQGTRPLTRDKFRRILDTVGCIYTEFSRLQPDFSRLSLRDQETLLRNAVPLFQQYVLGRYFRASSGYDQVRWLLASQAPELTSAQSWRTMDVRSLAQVSQTLGLWSEGTDLAAYDALCRKLDRPVFKFNCSSLVSICVLFHNLDRPEEFDDFEAVKRNHKFTYDFIDWAAGSVFECGSECELRSLATDLAPMADFYAKHARIHPSNKGYMQNDARLGDPHLDGQWLLLQFQLLDESFHAVSFDEELIREWVMWSYDVPLSKQWTLKALAVWRGRFGHFYKSQAATADLDPPEANVLLAVAVSLARLETCPSGKQQLRFALGLSQEAIFEKYFNNCVLDLDRLKRLTLWEADAPIGLFDKSLLQRFGSLVDRLAGLLGRETDRYKLFTLTVLLETSPPNPLGARCRRILLKSVGVDEFNLAMGCANEMVGIIGMMVGK